MCGGSKIIYEETRYANDNAVYEHSDELVLASLEKSLKENAEIWEELANR